MWWCCGKRSIDANGCNFNKHVTKNDDEDFEASTVLMKDEAKMRRCLCCRELGHKTESCSRDPNPQTNQDVVEEQARISKIKTFRPMHVDACIKTA
jgi:hypothetical protein